MRRVAALVAALALTLAGCADGGSESAPPIERYVALGDSYTSGAGMAGTEPGTGLCAQSRLAYPQLVAAALDAALVDASCGGAATEHVTGPQPRPGGRSWPAQLDSVAAGTDVVSVGFGYNDLGLLGGLIGCAGTCEELRELPAQIGPRVGAVVDSVRAAAPDAEVLVVGYPRIAPDRGGCAALTVDPALAREVLAALSDALADAARAAGATYVDVYGASAGHDVCAGDEAWLSGATGSPDQRAPYHPRPGGHEAVAALVLAALGR